MKFRALLIVAFLSVAATAVRADQIFTREEIDFIGGKANGSESRTQLIYHYLRKDRDTQIKDAPPWLDNKVLDAMVSRPVWSDPEDGKLNEAQLWQSPVTVLYEFFEVVRKSFPPADQGQFAPPAELLKEYEECRVRFQMSLDRLVRARMGNSLNGRGRILISKYQLISSQMDSVIDALEAGNTQQYKEAILAIAALNNAVFHSLHEPIRGNSLEDPPESKTAKTMAGIFAGLCAMFALFAGYQAGAINEDNILGAVERYKAKAKEWAHEYERQFIVIRVHYLVGVPAVMGFALGVLSFDIFGFLIFTGFGIYLGLILPGFLLKNIRLRRGLKCEAQLMDSMILMSNGLKSGIDLIGCIEMVTKEGLPPISEEFGLCLKNYHLGTSIEKALEGVEDRVQSRLLSYMIKAVVIQRSVGGNLTRIFDRIVENIREESKLAEKVAAMTAQQRIQSIVVGAMPWVMLVIMFLFQPQVMREYYFSPLGVMTLLFCTVWISIGMKTVSKLGEINV